MNLEKLTPFLLPGSILILALTQVPQFVESYHFNSCMSVLSERTDRAYRQGDWDRKTRGGWVANHVNYCMGGGEKPIGVTP